MTVAPMNAVETLLCSARRLAAAGQYPAAIKCLRAALRNEPAPDVQFAATKLLVSLYIHHTDNLDHGRAALNTMVR